MLNVKISLVAAAVALSLPVAANAASKVPAAPAAAPAPVAAKEPSKVYAFVRGRIRPGKYEEAVAFIRHEHKLVGDLNTGVRMIKSYHFQIGAEAGEFVDIWEAPDYNTLMRVFTAGPKEPTAEEGELFSSLSVQTATELPLDE